VQANFEYIILKIYKMGEKENNNNQNRSPVARWFRNAVLGATMAN
jgi:hypothetical protein